MIPTRFTFTQSNLSCFKYCARRFELRYMKQMIWPVQPSEEQAAFQETMEAGNRFHQLVHQHLLGVPRDILDRIAKADRFPLFEQWYRNWLRAGFGDLPQPIFPEHTLAIQFEEFLLSAKYDLLLPKPGRIIIFDWKTSHKPPNPSFLFKSLQTKVYTVVLSEALKNESDQVDINSLRMTYWEANFPDIDINIEPTTDQLAQYRAEILDLIKDIASESQQFLKTVRLERCAICEYRTFCERQSEAEPISSDLVIEEEALLSGQTLPVEQFLTPPWM
ncbi:MAG: PD-(D/E)XK nuclease family protein [Anaerolineaceae bacterium]|jgi:hypothetical protein